MIVLVQAAIEWREIGRIYGPLGVMCFLFALLIWKGLLPYIKKQHEEHVAALQSTVDDSRKERDYNRTLREKEVDKFLTSLEFRDEKMERGFNEVVRVLQDIQRK